MSHLRLGICLLLVLCACRPSAWVPDPGLLLPWSPEAQESQPWPLPYVAVFEQGAKALTYVAADHDNKLDSDTFRAVRWAFDDSRPQVVVIEGVRSEAGFNEPKLLELLRTAPPSQLYEQRFEPGYAAQLAHDAGVPFIGAEPSEAELIATCQRRGVSLEDLFGLYVVRQTSQWRRAGKLETTPIEQLVEERAQSMAQRAGFDRDLLPSFEGFLAWYQRGMGEPYDPTRIGTGDAAPLGGPEATLPQRVNFHVNHARNEHIVGVIAAMLDDHDRVLVVYGGGHLLQQEPVLEALFGHPPRYEKP